MTATLSAEVPPGRPPAETTWAAFAPAFRMTAQRG